MTKKISLSLLSACFVSIYALFSLSAGSVVFALTPKEQKGVKVLKMDTLEYTSPDWLRPVWLLDASSDVSSWLGVLPYDEDKNADIYIVIPTLGIITPVIVIPKWSADYQNMSKWREININNYLVNGVLHYTQTALPGEEGNMVIFGHSNYFKNKPGKYKTIFADLMNLDVGAEDEIWLYTKQSNGNYKQFKYAITESYETDPSDVAILLPLWGKEITVFACTNGLAGRRIVKGFLLEGNDLFVGTEMRIRVSKASKRFAGFPQELQMNIRDQIFERIAQKENAFSADGYTSEQIALRAAWFAYIERALHMNGEVGF